MDKTKSGNYIKEKRISLGLKESDVAAKLGVGVYEITCWEAGFFPDVQYLLPLSDVLNVTVEEILKGEDAPSSEPIQTIDPVSQTETVQSPAPPQPSQTSETVPSPTPAPPPVNKTSAAPPKPKKAEKSYYEKLHENMRYTDENGQPYLSDKDLNGFSSGERGFGYAVCAVFLALILLVNIAFFFKYLNRDRSLTVENCSEYMTVDVNFDNGEQQYYVEIKALKDIFDFSISLELTFENISTKKQFTKNVSFECPNLLQGTTLKQELPQESAYSFLKTKKIISVSGGLN